jgi:hypothetical protein
MDVLGSALCTVSRPRYTKAYGTKGLDFLENINNVARTANHTMELGPLLLGWAVLAPSLREATTVGMALCLGADSGSAVNVGRYPMHGGLLGCWLTSVTRLSDGLANLPHADGVSL